MAFLFLFWKSPINYIFLFKLTCVCRDGKEDWVPFDSSLYCSTSSYDAAAPFLHDVVDSLNSLNITVEQV